MFKSMLLMTAALSTMLAACGGGGQPTSVGHAPLERGDRAVSASSELKLLGAPTGGAGSAADSAAIARLARSAGRVEDSAGNVFVADRTEHTIRRIAPNGAVSTLAGTPGVRGAADGQGAVALFDTPWGLALDGEGGLYVADSRNHTVRRVVIEPQAGNVGSVTTVAGTAGMPVTSQLDSPRGLAYGKGQLFIADTRNHAIRVLATDTGQISTYAGTPGVAGSVSTRTPTASAMFRAPSALALSATGALYVLDGNNCVIRRISHDVVDTVTGTSKECE